MADPRYRGQHVRLRAGIIARITAGEIVHCTNPTCLHPGVPITAERGTPLSLDLGHTPDGTAHRGPEHAVCNRTEGARAGAAAINAQRTNQRTSWEW